MQTSIYSLAAPTIIAVNGKARTTDAESGVKTGTASADGGDTAAAGAKSMMRLPTWKRLRISTANRGHVKTTWNVEPISRNPLHRRKFGS